MPKILIADDDPNILKLLNIVFLQEGYTVVSAANGLEAIEKIKSEKPDLVVLDVMMPGLDGFHIALELKLRDDYDMPETKYILLTARGEKKDMELGRRLGAVAYMVKPFDVEELLKTVRGVFS